MNKFIQKYLFWLIVFAILAGLLLVKFTGGYDFNPLFCLLAAFLMIYPSLVPLDFDKIKEISRHKKLILISIIINFLILPLFAIFVGWIFLSDNPFLWAGLVLLSITPGGGMVTTWAYKSKADMPLTVGLVFANLLVAVVLIPFYLTYIINKLNYIATKVVTEASNESCAIDTVTNGTVSCLFDNSGEISLIKIALPILVIIILPLVLAFLLRNY